MNSKKQIIEYADIIAGELIELSRKIHERPELAFNEYEAVGNITKLLGKHGFTVENGIAGMDTAFRAEFKGRSGDGPTVAFLAEYDALPEIGHGCGHNLIAAMSAGAAIALSKAANMLDCKIVVLGTPAEEGGGGKIIMVEKGCFEDIDYALMIHPSTENLICRGGLATRGLDIEFYGKSAHSAAPETGINALQAVIQAFNGIDHLRALMPLKANVNGIITEGGKASNIIPDYASCKFSVRADTVSDLKQVVSYIEKAVSSAESLTGARSKVTKSLIYTERYPNKCIDEKLKENIAEFGEVMEYPDPNMKYGSSDIGNVSLVVPAIHSYLKVAEVDVNSHSIDFTKAAITDYAHQQMIKGVKALAMTGYDIITDVELQKNINKEFNDKVPKYTEADLK